MNPATVTLRLLWAAFPVAAIAAAPDQGLYPVEKSPFRDKPAISYSSPRDASGKLVPMVWGDAPFFDFGSRPVEMDLRGVRAIPQAPAAGVHPRIFFGPGELPEVRRRVRETRTGQEAWKNILSWTEAMKGTYDDTADYAKPDKFKGSFGRLHGRVPLFRLGLPENPGQSKYVRSAPAAKLYQDLAAGTATAVPDYYWNVFALEAFRCLIDEDRAGGEKLAAAVQTALRLGQEKRAAERQKAEEAKKDVPPPTQPVGGFQLAFVYDFLFNWLTPEQKQAIHAELADTTWRHDNYGTFNTAESSRSNWATFSYWLYQVLAIEGEEGFNDLKVRGMFRGWRNLLTYGWFASGATFEGEGKNQVGMDGILLFAARQKDYGLENLAGHPYLQAYARNFLPHSLNPMLNGFHKYDLLGGSRAGSGGFAPMDNLGFKFVFPEDKVVDWVYRKAIGENYQNVPDRPDGYFNALLFYAIYAADFDPANDDPAKLGLGNTFFCGERSLLMTRSSWDPGATMLNMHTRGASGGHEFADRNGIMVAGAGRIWSPNGYANFATTENSVVVIDGQTQNLSTPGRMVDFVDTAEATFAVGDAKPAWDWTWRRLEKKPGYYTMADVEAGKVEIPAGFEPVKNTTNDYALTRLPYAYLNRPIFEYAHWILPNGALSPYVRKPLLPVQKAFRSAGLVRSEKPYILVVDDIQRNDQPCRYDWALLLEYDVQIAGVKPSPDGTGTDIFLWGADPDQTAKRPADALPGWVAEGTTIPDGAPMLLVRVLHRAEAAASPEPEIVEVPNRNNPKKYPRVRRLLVPSVAASPDFKVLLFPHRKGDALPQTAWMKGGKALTVRVGGVTDEFVFGRAETGKTDVTMTRGGRPVLILDKPVAALP
jgi:hypothetical protein